ncbi:MAG: hypothetical protein K2M16_10185 [Muribaculaceae bacterium]|nr:hypothetical protein [Muribaculaceae bacterium]
MKKFTTLLMASFFLMPSLSLGQNVMPLNSGAGKTPTHRIDNQRIPGATLKNAQAADLKSHAPKKNVAETTDYSNIIYEAPAGETKVMARAGDGTYAYYGRLVNITYENKISELVVCDDGYVYMKNPMSQYVSDTYLKGKQEGNKIVFDLPQSVAAIDYNGGEIYFLITTMQYCESEDWYYPCNTPEAKELGLPEITDQLTVNINADGSYSMDIDPDRTLIPGMIYSDNFSWTGYSELSSEWKEFNGDLNVGPADDVVLEDMMVIYGDMGHYGAKLAIDGDKVFVKGLFSEQPDSWIEGKIDGDKISFQSGQYVGEDTTYGYYTYFCGATVGQAWDEDYEEWYDVYNYTDELVFTYDKENQTLTAGESDVAVYNTSDHTIAYLSVLNSPVLKVQPAVISQTPQNPFNLEFFDYLDSYGYSWIQFNLPMFNTEGVLLNVEDLYYKVYVDGDEYEFSSDEYFKLEDDMTLVPYNFSEDYDFIVNDTYHEVYLYFAGAEELGVQLCSVKDGEILGASDIVSINITTGVKSVEDYSCKRIASVSYFNMNGQQVANPQAGVFVKTVSYEDGSVRSYKVVSR